MSVVARNTVVFIVLTALLVLGVTYANKQEEVTAVSAETAPVDPTVTPDVPVVLEVVQQPADAVTTTQTDAAVVPEAQTDAAVPAVQPQ